MKWNCRADAAAAGPVGVGPGGVAIEATHWQYTSPRAASDCILAHTAPHHGNMPRHKRDIDYVYVEDGAPVRGREIKSGCLVAAKKAL